MTSRKQAFTAISFISALILSLAAGLFHSPSANAQKMQSVTWKSICENPAPLPVIGEVQTHPSSLDMASYWSVGCETMDRDYADFEKFKQFVGQTGVGYARLQSGWAKTEKKKGRYDFSWLDKHVDGLIEQGVKPWLCLCYGNPLYSDHGIDLDAKLFPDGPIMDGWLSYVRAVVKHYKGKISMYEVWNEPDNKKALDSYDLYANLYIRTAEVIREVDPEVRIAAFGSCSPNLAYLRQSMKKIAESGGIGYVDCLTYHAYWPIPEYIVPAVKQLQKDLSVYSDKIQYLQGETGCPAHLEYGHALRNHQWDEVSQAKWDLRNMLTHFSMGIPYSVFTMVDLNYGWMQQSFGLVRTDLNCVPQYLRPKFHAVQNVTGVFTMDMVPDTTVVVNSSCGRKLFTCGVSKNGKAVGCLVWFCDDKPDGSLTRELASIEIEGVDFAEPVYVDMLDGKVHSLPMTGYKGAFDSGTCFLSRVPLWDSPVLIIDRSAIDMK